jgi:pyruvate dehydrogenase E1 component alpha subunit
MFARSLTKLPAFVARANKSHTSRGFASGTVTIDVGADAFETHNFEKPSTQVTTNKEEMIRFLTEMYTMRRMEITNDTEYKARNIRGFCHLYDGQEAVASGMNFSLDKEDSWITSYRCHCVALLRGSSVQEVFEEMFGFVGGTAKGRGGSMHFYRKSANFFGGQGIVGAQVPVGAGLAFANKYMSKPGEKMNIAVAGYGDGAANQGQIWEAANMAKLWGLPVALYIENNHYGMGTSTKRSSCNDHYYTMGGRTIPGIKIDGMNVLSVKQGVAAVRDWCASGNGPIYMEFDTYRYHGHSMSDPGTTYRTREEVGSVRQSRDPIEYVKKVILDNSFATEAEIKDIEKNIRNSVQEALVRAKAGSFPPSEDLYRLVYADKDGKDEPQKFLRMPDFTKSIQN